MQPLEGKSAVVTGSSSGIGRAIALELAASGANVIIHGATSVSGAKQTETLVREFGRLATVRMCDLSDGQLRRQFVDDCWTKQGPIDIWVNNAGSDVLTGEAANWTFEKKLQRLWEVDVLGTIGISRDVGKRMVGETYSSGLPPAIVNIGWDQAPPSVGMSGESGELFAAAKGAIMSFTRSLARSLGPHVRVNCVAPGWIKTKWGSVASDYWNTRAISESLMERWGTAEDVAKTVRYAVSADAAFVSGQILNVNGGYRGEIL